MRVFSELEEASKGQIQTFEIQIKLQLLEMATLYFEIVMFKWQRNIGTWFQETYPKLGKISQKILINILTILQF